ncbi:MAG: nucleotide sugar dehydrogenase [Anaerolineae bacterium]|nr:nucleotide sugar dehydrogenase [Anaerolineae bacterium]
MTQTQQNALQKIKERRTVVGVIGLGYVGLPLAIAFVEAGFRVVGLDLDQGRVEAINRGESYVEDIPSAILSRYLAKNKSGQGLSATTDYTVLRQTDAVIVCVPTPLNKTKDPELSFLLSAADRIAQHLHPGMLVVLESTTYPGTTEELILPLLQYTNQQAFKVGSDFFLAFSPERIDPGRKDWTVHTTPKIIGGMTPACLEVAQALYGCAIEQVVPVSSPRVAEMVKLLENTFRAVNIALVNEVAIMCDRLGIEVWEVIEAARTKPFGFMPFYPGPGLGGHCIPIDPEYLAWKLKTLNYNARFIQLAAEINFGMPHYVLGKIVDALNDDGKAVKGARILILGVAYKADIGDLRESPALDLIHLLQAKGAKVSYHDPYVPQLDQDDIVMTGATLDQSVLEQADCVVITTAHSSYDWEWVVKNSQLVVDTRNATQGVIGSSGRVVKL